MDWNIEQLEIAIRQLDEIQARFYMDSIGNEVADILNDAQRKLIDILSHEKQED